MRRHKWQTLLLLLINYFAIDAANAESLFPLTQLEITSKATPTRDSPFNTEPAEEALVKEGESGPTLKCKLADDYRDQSRYEAMWIKVVGGFPM